MEPRSTGLDHKIENQNLDANTSPARRCFGFHVPRIIHLNQESRGREAMQSFSASHHAVIGQTSSWASCTSCTCKALDIMLAMHCANSILDFIDSFCQLRQKVPAMSLPYLLAASLMSQLRKVNFSSTHLCELYRAPVDRGESSLFAVSTFACFATDGFFIAFSAFIAFCAAGRSLHHCNGLSSEMKQSTSYVIACNAPDISAHDLISGHAMLS